MRNKKIFMSMLFICILFVSFLGVSGEIVSAETTETELKYLQINNTKLGFKEIIYVDDTNGSDTIGDGSKSKPFNTVVKGFDYLNDNCREGGAIVIKDGTYDVGGLFEGYSYALNNRYGDMKISLLAENMGKVEFTNIGEWIQIENSIETSVISNTKVSLYGIIFKSIIQPFYCLGGDSWTNEYYNCVFPANYGGWNVLYTDAAIKVENSLFIGLPSKDYDIAPLTGSAINCASTTQYIEPKNGTKTTCLNNVTIDSNYNITSSGWKNTGTGINPDNSTANIGVYGGQFAWGSKVIELTPDPVITGNAILVITMDNGAIKEYNLTGEELNDFLKWYDSRTSVKAYYTFNARSNVIPFKSIINYIPYDKILYFDVKMYDD